MIQESDASAREGALPLMSQPDVAGPGPMANDVKAKSADSRSHPTDKRYAGQWCRVDRSQPAALKPTRCPETLPSALRSSRVQVQVLRGDAPARLG
ncbi:hypothetical protein GCM10007860_25640 [Chitiniphilus shinanonensis]|uniref:Uncharacterized protein n=1 Tax=Chitiniphilus shinanonensis TaxID=553088 RepID=A0ABQ6BVC3_9NEIS|nr:hypothetical protein GCM10007860_25640 [Chitiniphilus shinanonensis]